MDDEQDAPKSHGLGARKRGKTKTDKKRTIPVRPHEGSQGETNVDADKAFRRGRGRPLKNAVTAAPTAAFGSIDNAQHGTLQSQQTNLQSGEERIILPSRILSEGLPSLSPTRSGTSRTSGRSSPSRFKGIKREHLVNLSPSIEFDTIVEAKEYLPPLVQSLWRDVVSNLVHETKVVPPQLKDRMRGLLNTPTKSRAPLNDNDLARTDRYRLEDLAFIWTTVSRVVKKASAQRTKNGPESQWCSFIVAPVLDLLHHLQCHTEGESLLEVLDISTTSIDPIDLCPYHQNPEVWKILNKKIDFAIGLDVPREQKIALKNGTYRYPHPHQPGTSINQTSSWVNYVPMFLNIEVKKKHASDDPMIQIGAWVAAEFRKRELEGYDLSMPVFAIEIEEDTWNLYIAYASGSTAHHLVFVGPESMGDTKSHQGVFKIMHVLEGLAEWGTTEYQAWFEQQVLPKHMI